LHTHAAGAEGARRLLEQLLAGRVVQVDRKGIGKADRQLAEGIVRPGFLAQEDIAGAVPVDAGRVELMAGVVQDPQLVLRQVVRVEADGRQFVLAKGGLRYPPRVANRAAAGTNIVLSHPCNNFVI
jgi:hypothetical protein